MYKVNPAKYTGVTVIPSEIAEKHLILASASLLKVIIYAFSKSSELLSTEEIAAGTGLSENEVTDGLSYWKNLGFILYEDEKIVLEENSQVSQSADEENKQTVSSDIPAKKTGKVPLNNPATLSYTEITARINESEDIRFLLQQSQLMLGRTIGTGDQSSLILLHDYYGLPVEVILCICKYAS